MAGIDHTVYREDVFLFAKIVNVNFLHVPQTGNELVGKAHLLCGFQCFNIAAVLFNNGFLVNNSFNRFKEVACYFCYVKQRVCVTAEAEGFGDSKDVVILKFADIVKKLRKGFSVKLRQPEVVSTRFK